MNSKIITTIIIMIAAVFAVAYDLSQIPEYSYESSEDGGLKRAAPAPDVTFTTLDGRRVALHDMKEKAILLHFWATWCAPCKVEFPDLVYTVEQYAGDVALIAVSTDDDPRKIEKFQEELRKKTGKRMNNQHIYWVWDKYKVLSSQEFNSSKVPETIFISPQKRMVAKAAGATDWLDPDIQSTIIALTALEEAEFTDETPEDPQQGETQTDVPQP